MLKWRKFIAACMLCVVLAISSGTARAADDEDQPQHDARTEGYQVSVKVEKNGSAITWLLFVFIGVVGMAVLFKDPKRSHLD